ncbi:MAG: TetR/AcrR family transcriptional regulator [Ectothiorhodospiraceae bacterium]|nr:TetR/AcrR family transcriptional regulator [Ectothiorhodospiraceae bacterium]
MDAETNRRTLTAEDWADAALEAIADGGVNAVAVERLARQLGVTKGSFYWHFSNRRALLRAALQRWEQQQTDEVLARAAVETDGATRIDRLFRSVDGSKRASQLYLAFAAAARDPMVSEVVRRVNQRRIVFMEENYQAMGLPPKGARQRAVLSYSVYLGTLQLRRDAPELIPAGPEFHEYMDCISEALIPGFDPARRQPGCGGEGASEG